MGVRPPTDDSTDTPETLAFGIAALDERLEHADLGFPADVETVRAAIGDEAVPYDGSGRTMTVAEALDDVEATRFDSEREFLNALHPVFEAQRRNSAPGLFGRLRSLVPF
ncbi:hypothetical protein [Halomarina ordinaria]|uniref:DUF2795 domain-containing protein n=1 Tax=Halomarina ordinaria TaxID=3033939 RepID=A0ABD5U629_9EURY|nr:hypothetical protein [Halomarina sp. PSRA2]